MDYYQTGPAVSTHDQRDIRTSLVIPASYGLGELFYHLYRMRPGSNICMVQHCVVTVELQELSKIQTRSIDYESGTKKFFLAEN